MSATLTLSEAQSRLSELLDHPLPDKERLTITQEGKPLAILVSPEEMALLDRLRAAVPEGSLLEVVGAWDGFEEIEPFIREARSSTAHVTNVTD